MRLFLLTLLAFPLLASAQADSLAIRRLFTESLERGQSYAQLRELTSLGTRLSGSAGYDRAAAWGERTLQSVVSGVPGARVWRQPVIVPHWIRGQEGKVRERVRILSGPGIKAQDLRGTALGGSIGTGGKPIEAEVVLVYSLDTLAKLGEALKGKIVFFNRPMPDAEPFPFTAYGRAGDQRRRGPTEAARYGAVAVLVRSLTQAHDDEPHTGNTAYAEGIPKVPAAALGRQSADRLAALLAQHPRLRVSLSLTAELLPDVEQPNVIAEVLGTERPNEVIVVGGHLDAWDLADGAHDDGAGCVHSIEALRLLLATGVRPKRTVRVVLFANEENGLRGALGYAAAAKGELEKGTRHIAAIESDAGGFSPRGFSVDGTPAQVARIARWSGLFTPYGAERIISGGGGADVTPLKPLGTIPIGLRPDPQRYFDFHHTPADRLPAVHPRELALGAAAMSSLLYLLTEYGAE